MLIKRHLPPTSLFSLTTLRRRRFCISDTCFTCARHRAGSHFGWQQFPWWPDRECIVENDNAPIIERVRREALEEPVAAGPSDRQPCAQTRALMLRWCKMIRVLETRKLDPVSHGNKSTAALRCKFPYVGSDRRIDARPLPSIESNTP